MRSPNHKDVKKNQTHIFLKKQSLMWMRTKTPVIFLVQSINVLPGGDRKALNQYKLSHKESFFLPFKLRSMNYQPIYLLLVACTFHETRYYFMQIDQKCVSHFWLFHIFTHWLVRTVRAKDKIKSCEPQAFSLVTLNISL